MITLLSPAKKLLTTLTPYTQYTSVPEFLSKTQELVKLMKLNSESEIARLMNLSKELAALNFKRYQNFVLNEVNVPDSYPALFYFQGDVYQGLQALQWDDKAVDYSQTHLRILSGLYGLLRPLDRIQSYRLEMGVRIANSSGANLYAFWKEQITQSLNHQLKEQANPILINLASTEYFKAVDEKKLNYPIVTINFYEKKQDQLKMVGILAKKARGAMAQFIMRHQIDDIELIKTFTGLGYSFNAASSSLSQLDFVRTD